MKAYLDHQIRGCVLFLKSKRYISLYMLRSRNFMLGYVNVICKLVVPSKYISYPVSTQKALLLKHPKASILTYWLQKKYGIKSCSVLENALQVSLCVSVTRDAYAAVTFFRFLYHSNQKSFLMDLDISFIIKSMPIVDGAGAVRRYSRIETLVPATGSKWSKLLRPVNPFQHQGYVDIGEAYAMSCKFVGEHTPDKALLSFLTVYAKANDLPDILPPNMALKLVSSQFTCEQAFLLLDWIRFHRTKGSKIPKLFVDSIRCGKWMKTEAGVDCPENCVIPNESGKVILEMLKNVPSYFSIINEDFYDGKISWYADKLKFIRVQYGINGVPYAFMHHFKLQASSLCW